MKKISLLFIVFLLCKPIFAQSQSNEINLGLGFFTSNEIINIATQIVVISITDDMRVEDSYNIGALHLAYRKSLNKRLDLGGVFAFESEFSKVTLKNANNLYDKIGDLKNTYITIGAELSFNYINQNKLKLYSLVGAGLGISNQSYTQESDNSVEKHADAYFNFQISPLGVKYGEKFGGFMEAGIGYKGFITVGFFARF